MANNHRHAPWRKSVLVPLWCFQIFCMLLFIALLGLAAGILVSHDNTGNEDWDNTSLGKVNDPELVVHVDTRVIIPIWITLCVACLILTITEIILLMRYQLRPLVFLIMNVFKASIWTGLFILDIISAVTNGGQKASVLGLIIDVILLFSFWIPLIYGSVIFHRFRKEKSSYKPVDHPYALPIDNHDPKYSSPIPQAYTPPTSEARDIESNSRHTIRVRGPSFNHERDTRYDTYRRTSLSPQQPETALFETLESRGLVTAGEGIPSVYVEHHDGEGFEMESRTALR